MSDVAPLVTEPTDAEEERKTRTDAVVTLGVVIAVLVLSVGVETFRLKEVRAEVRAG